MTIKKEPATSANVTGHKDNNICNYHTTYSTKSKENRKHCIIEMISSIENEKTLCRIYDFVFWCYKKDGVKA